MDLPLLLPGCNGDSLDCSSLRQWRLHFVVNRCVFGVVDRGSGTMLVARSVLGWVCMLVCGGFGDAGERAALVQSLKLLPDHVCSE